MESISDFDDPKSIALAKKLWGDESILEDEKIPVWLDCDTGHDVSFSLSARNSD
jgi:hypothetical protein